jgi:glutamate synthase domain-containing protein 2
MDKKMTTDREIKKIKISSWHALPENQPLHIMVTNVDLVAIKYGQNISVLYGRCLHRGALLADGHIEGGNLICGVHGWDYRFDTGISEYNNQEFLHKFNAWVDEKADAVYMDENEVVAWEKENPQPYRRDLYLGLYADIHGSAEEPHNHYIHELARHGLSKFGFHGPVSAMGVPLNQLPQWTDIQVVTAQLARKPLLDDANLQTKLVIGPRAKKPLQLDIPILISDMSFGALSEEAKVALAKGAELAGTGICSGEGGMLPEEQNNNSKYFYELASGRFGWDLEKVQRCQAFHFKAGQGAKTGTGGHLPAAKVTKKIAQVRGLQEGQDAISPSRFADLNTTADYRNFADTVRKASGGIPVGFKMSAQHIEADLDFALEVGVDYIILDGRGGGTGAAPDLFKNNISIPTIPALARARHHLDKRGAKDVTLIITGGLRTESDFIKALALGADGIAIANSAIQAIGCLGMRACNTNNCPVGIATQKEHLRRRLDIGTSAQQLKNFLQATVDLMKIMARACGHTHLNGFSINDLATYKREMADLTGIRYAGLI